MNKLLYFILLLMLFSCSGEKMKEAVDTNLSWEETLESANGEQVTLMMWQGDPLINDYMKSYVVPVVKQQFGVDLKVISGQGNKLVSTLMTELEAGKTESEIDMMWINGETFFQLRQINALYGPFSKDLPNSQYIDWANPFIGIDFQQTIDGYECPWGNVQMAIIYNSEKVQNPPMDLQELEEFLKKNPGKFTIGNDFTGITLLKSWLIHLAGGNDALKGDFDPVKYKKFSHELWKYINRIKPNFWNKGETFPSSVAQMHQLFANGELWFSLSNNDSEVDNKIQQGIFSKSAKAYVPEIGTIQNSHFMGISKNSIHKNAAKVVCNFLISPEAQLHKLNPKIWGDGTVLSMDKLPSEWREKFDNIPERRNSPVRTEIQEKALMEPAPEYMLHLFEDFRKYIIEEQKID